MRAGLEKALQRAWTGHGPLACALLPVAALYATLARLHWLSYRWGWQKSKRVPVPVIVVGNVIAGGAGKTPTAMALVAHLQAAHWHVGIVSRGYSRTRSDCQEVLPHSAPDAVGDEPLLIKRKTQAPVFVAADRHTAAMALLAKYPETQLIICDDGLQHYALHRDLEVCVFDARGTGNGWRLPAGPLRETWPRRALQAVGQDDMRMLVLKTGPSAVPGFQATRALADYGLDRHGLTTPLADLCAPGAPPVIAVAGIAQPDAFFTMLRAAGLPLVKTMALPDHYDFDSFSINIDEGYSLICTEKDAEKLWRTHPNALAVPLLQTLPHEFYAALEQCLPSPPTPPVSSRHGHQIT